MKKSGNVLLAAATAFTATAIAAEFLPARKVVAEKPTDDLIMHNAVVAVGKMALARQQTDHIRGERFPDPVVKGGTDILIKTYDGSRAYLIVVGMRKTKGKLDPTKSYTAITSQFYDHSNANKSELGILGDYPLGDEAFYGFSDEFSQSDQHDPLNNKTVDGSLGPDHTIGATKLSQDLRDSAESSLRFPSINPNKDLSNPNII